MSWVELQLRRPMRVEGSVKVHQRAVVWSGNDDLRYQVEVWERDWTDEQFEVRVLKWMTVNRSWLRADTWPPALMGLIHRVIQDAMGGVTLPDSVFAGDGVFEAGADLTALVVGAVIGNRLGPYWSPPGVSTAGQWIYPENAWWDVDVYRAAVEQGRPVIRPDELGTRQALRDAGFDQDEITEAVVAYVEQLRRARR